MSSSLTTHKYKQSLFTPNLQLSLVPQKEILDQSRFCLGVLQRLFVLRRLLLVFAPDPLDGLVFLHLKALQQGFELGLRHAQIKLLEEMTI